MICSREMLRDVQSVVLASACPVCTRLVCQCVTAVVSVYRGRMVHRARAPRTIVKVTGDDLVVVARTYYDLQPVGPVKIIIGGLSDDMLLGRTMT
jgi:hypothetical protein